MIVRDTAKSIIIQKYILTLSITFKKLHGRIIKQRVTLKYKIPFHNHFLVYRIAPPFNIIPRETKKNSLQPGFAPCRLPWEGETNMKGNPRLCLLSPSKLDTLYFFTCYYVYITDMIRNLELCLLVVLILLKIKFGYAQISVPKISIYIEHCFVTLL